jgi:hypothetical protein
VSGLAVDASLRDNHIRLEQSPTGVDQILELILVKCRNADERVDAAREQHLGLQNVPESREQALIQQGLTNW